MTCGRDLGYTCSDSPGLAHPGCGQHFGSLRTFDFHLRTPERRCMTPAQMRRRGLRLKDDGTWTDEPPMRAERQTSLGLRRGRPRTPRRKIRGEALRRRIRRDRGISLPGVGEADVAVPPQEERGPE